MSTIIFHSQPMSVYLWTASLVAAEKHVPWTVRVIEPGSDEHRRFNPFAKSPVLEHGAILLYETLAIAHYIDRAFDGPELQPESALDQAEMLRWVSLVNAYMFPTMTNGLAKERLLVPSQGGVPDEALIERSAGEFRHQLGVIDRALASNPFLAGEEISIADCFLFPHLHLASLTPEGADALAHARMASAWLARMRARPSYAATDQLRQKAA
ncbi:glutathione S-transferase family protein [Parvibaculum sp.]|uniref:glutathione S-transferase family protein n=1 Tax=Parvibaculum sp. TaxID=2024848 RepID=UPI00320C7EA0